MMANAAQNISLQYSKPKKDITTVKFSEHHTQAGAEQLALDAQVDQYAH